MTEEKTEASIINFNDPIIKGNKIPGIQALSDNILEASDSGILFFLAVEVDLLLRAYLKQNGLSPTPVELEMMIAQAAKAMTGE